MADGGQAAVWTNNAVIESDTTGGRWQTRIAFPLVDLIPGGAQIGRPFYINVFRAMLTLGESLIISNYRMETVAEGGKELYYLPDQSPWNCNIGWHRNMAYISHRNCEYMLCGHLFSLVYSLSWIGHSAGYSCLSAGFRNTYD